MYFHTVKLEANSATRRIRLHRPNDLNPINMRMLAVLAEGFALLAVDLVVKVIMLSGLPGYFCTGMDFRESMESHPSPGTLAEGDFPPEYCRLSRQLSLCPKAV